jgi:hypothetical protein
MADDFRGDSSTTGVLKLKTPTNGAITFNGDRDWFRIDMIAGRTYELVLTGTPLANPYLKLWNKDSGLVNSGPTSDTTTTKIIHKATYSGTHFVDAGAYGFMTQGRYELSAKDITLTPRLPEETASDIAGNPSTERSIRPGGSAISIVSFHGDRDWFRIRLEAGKKYVFKLNGITLGNPLLKVFNDRGGQQAAKFGDSSPPRNSASISFTPSSTGNYYLEAGAVGFIDGGSYELIAAETGRIQRASLRKDRLTGTASEADKFIWKQPNFSRLSRYDVITNYEKQDTISFRNPRFNAVLNTVSGRLNSLSKRGISNLLGGTDFKPFASALFKVRGIRGTFLATNDQTAGFQAASDSIILLKNYNASLANSVSIGI